MATNEEKVTPMLELTMYVRDFCEKNKMSCLVSVVKKDGFKNSIGCIIGGNLKELSSALNETMKREEKVAEIINEAFLLNLADKMAKDLELSLEEVIVLLRRSIFF